MDLKDIGEFGFINRFSSKFDTLIQEGEMGIGDDCAILPLNETDNYVVTTDLLIEDVHFVLDKISPEELGHKALAASLSDIASMGAEPKFSFLSLAVPKGLSVDYLDGFMNGYHALSHKYSTPLMGGDTTSSPDKLMVNIVVIGQSKKTETRLRSMAKEGDVICVTGQLGDSAGGLKVILENLMLNSDTLNLKRKHHNPEPRIKEGMWLAKQTSVHAMMDVSDGISSDLLHILKASQLSAQIDTEHLPCSKTLREVALKHHWDFTKLATSGGEDYELLFTVDSQAIDVLKADYAKEFSEVITVIGKVAKGKASITWKEKNKEISLDKEGFNHFTNYYH